MFQIKIYFKNLMMKKQLYLPIKPYEMNLLTADKARIVT